jgi:hypothetical protein
MLFKKFIVATAVVSFTLVPIEAMAKTKQAKPVAPTGEARAKQFKAVLKDCQKKYGGVGEVWAEWASYYGRTGWFCVHRS